MTKKLFEVNGIKIGKGFEPYIIAELSANHGGSIERAKASISAAKKAGVSAVKIQSYTPDTMTIESDKSDFQIKEGKPFSQRLPHSKNVPPATRGQQKTPERDGLVSHCSSCVGTRERNSASPSRFLCWGGLLGSDPPHRIVFRLTGVEGLVEHGARWRYSNHCPSWNGATESVNGR